MKKGFIIALLLNLVILTAYYQENIINFISSFYNKEDEIKVSNIIYNKYASNFNYLYIDDTNNAIPKSFDDLKKVYYSSLNSGMKQIDFYCADEYLNCVNDVASISNAKTFLNSLNNYVHPYNSYESLSTSIYGNEITILIDHNYNEEMINAINNRVNEIIEEYITDNMDDREKIRVIHDYIINNTKYDQTKSGNSHLAYGALIEGSAICGGYTDAMSIFLYKFNIPNYKVNNEEHIWNLVKLDGKWYHLDLTWDDPVSEITDLLTHRYFLITDEELKEKNDGEHHYNPQTFLELNN